MRAFGIIYFAVFVIGLEIIDLKSGSQGHSLDALTRAELMIYADRVRTTIYFQDSRNP